MYKTDSDLDGAFENAKELFNNRVLKHNEDKLFLTPYSKQQSLYLHNKALIRMATWEKILNKKTLI